MVSPTFVGNTNTIATIGGDWHPVYCIFKWNMPVDDGEAKVVYGIDIIPFSGSKGHTLHIKGNHTLIITADYPDAFGKPKAVHDTKAKDVFMNMLTDPNAKSKYDNLLVCSVAAVQHLIHGSNELRHNHGKAMFTVYFAKDVDKK